MLCARVCVGVGACVCVLDVTHQLSSDVFFDAIGPTQPERAR